MERQARNLAYTLRAAVLATAAGLFLYVAADVRAQQPATAAAASSQPQPGRGRGPVPLDPRVQVRMHHVADSDRDIPYALFVSSKVKRDTKAPLIVTLHGLGGTVWLREQCAAVFKDHQWLQSPPGPAPFLES